MTEAHLMVSAENEGPQSFENSPELMRLAALWSIMEQPKVSSGIEQRARLAKADLWKTLLGSERQQLVLGTVITKPASCRRGDMPA